jgi:hypothetical protein
VFNERATHSFPPVFVMPAEWRPEVEAMAADLEFHIRTAEAIEQRFREIIEALNQNAKPLEHSDGSRKRRSLQFRMSEWRHHLNL